MTVHCLAGATSTSTSVMSPSSDSRRNVSPELSSMFLLRPPPVALKHTAPWQVLVRNTQSGPESSHTPTYTLSYSLTLSYSHTHTHTHTHTHARTHARTHTPHTHTHTHTHTHHTHTHTHTHTCCVGGDCASYTSVQLCLQSLAHVDHSVQRCVRCSPPG